MKMTKIALMMASAASFANAEAHKGFSVGVNAGWAHLDSKVKFSTSNSSPTVSSNELSGRGVVAGLNLGYFHTMGTLNLGGQLQANLSTANGKSSQTLPSSFARDLKVNQKWEANLSARLGVNLNGAVPYVRLGASLSSFQAKATAYGMPAASKKKSVVGPLVGAGADVALNDKMTVGADLRVTFYPQYRVDQVVTDTSPVTYSNTVKTTSMVGSVGVKYFF